MRGSKYELKFDFKGQPINEEDVKVILKKEKKSSTNNKKSEEEKMSL